MKKVILLSVLASVSVAFAEQSDKIGVNVNTRLVSKHIWRGFDQFNDKGAIQATANFDWFGSGFTSTLWTCWALSDGSENQEEMDYIMAYNDSLWDGETLQTNYKLNYIYYDFPNTYSKHKDAQEIGMGFYWPKVFSGAVENLVPSYYVGRLWPSKSDGANRKAAGFIHIFGVDYDIPFNLDSKEDYVHFAAKAFYNDGMGGVDQDWSHVLLSLSKNIPVGEITVTPELNYQISMEDSVNTENELYTGITIAYSF